MTTLHTRRKLIAISATANSDQGWKEISQCGKGRELSKHIIQCILKLIVTDVSAVPKENENG